VDQQFSDPDTVLHDGCEVAFIPPVSGGSEGGSHRAAVPPPVTDAWCAITTEPLDAAALTRAVQTPEDGAVVTFAGVVRNNFAGHPTAYLTYEAYTEMAVPVLSQIVQEARTRWHIGHAAVHHRVGKLDIGETAVLVVVAAPHRQAGFAAVAYIMDRIKQIAPIWKCEHWADGSSTWQG
jgi:molybdopterin synthase catalytic subunit